jgi:hypothetical protein
MASDYVANPTNARHKAAQRGRYTDPQPYTEPAKKRIDAKFALTETLNELLAIIDSEVVGRRVRVKNTSGGTYVKGSLIHPDTAKLTAQTSAVASNSPAAGANAVYNVAATFEVGQIVEITDGVNTDYGAVAAAAAGISVTIEMLFYTFTTPTITALPAYEATLSDADGMLPAEWVLTADLAASGYGWAYDMAEVTGLDTSAFVAEDLLYLSATAGTYTKVAPSGIDQIVQVVGIVKTVNAVTGKVLFMPGLKRILKYGSSALQPGAGMVLTTANGAAMAFTSISEEITLAAAATTDSVANLLPANALIEGVCYRVTTLLPAASTFKLGDALTDDLFAAAATSGALGTTSDMFTRGTPPYLNTGGAAKVRVTPSGGAAAAGGKIRVTVFYRTLTAPTS